jgi:hypothetical protein
MSSFNLSNCLTGTRPKQVPVKQAFFFAVIHSRYPAFNLHITLLPAFSVFIFQTGEYKWENYLEQME